MKEIKSDKKMYVCDTCEKTSHCKGDIIECEERHRQDACEHGEYCYISDEHSRDPGISIQKICIKCKAIIAYRDFRPSTIYDETAEALFNLNVYEG